MKLGLQPTELIFLVTYTVMQVKTAIKSCSKERLIRKLRKILLVSSIFFMGLDSTKNVYQFLPMFTNVYQFFIYTNILPIVYQYFQNMRM